MSRPRIGLALGGGGARGMSHIPVLQAFDDLGVKPDVIAGSSIGALLGAGYAAGLSGNELHELAVSTFRNRNALLAKLWQLRPRRIADVFGGGIGQFDPLKVLHLFAGGRLPDRFEDLKIPLTVVATDFYGCAEIDIQTGPLAPAIAASIAIPAVFRPVKLQGKVLIDGGVANPLPFDRLPDTCDIIVAADVVGVPVPRPGKHLPTTLDALFGASQILMRSITQEKLKQREPDVIVRPDVGNIRVLDFMKTRGVLDAAAPLREEVKRRLTAALDKQLSQ
ncbi:patatin-like phospholipase family protein [Microvirga tunisiensis]|uniref:Patatin-like phospholipase family protein n=2 Tax=Pannonibacter tanglangensis TaxID=2750084 RepID=A0A7X5J8R9_9HYPH|nr:MULTISPECIES: patatin-like phospholipase family protein [unclassified Pannonibacter]NBN64457.1 patatin-like phospholipase family protein [Pannonibacter sp. XCT-34]NBN78989.1 patatin-like phospholipase family protein [Pannonibacter sp. XCT-53]